jgi:periplasmic divalent cation tolerance protein
MDEAVLVYTTWPDAETAGTAAAAAVEARLAACANLLAPIASVYRWEGAVEKAVETPVIFKTTAAHAGRLKAFILSRHPYDTPCILALPVKADGSHLDYVAWIVAETGEN